MKAPLFVRPLAEDEQRTLAAGLRAADAFTMRRCQILLASSKGQCPSEIARNRGCSLQMVRNVINAFPVEGLDCLKPTSCRPKIVFPIFDQEKAPCLRSNWLAVSANTLALTITNTLSRVSHELAPGVFAD